jgi:hypothetical protein
MIKEKLFELVLSFIWLKSIVTIEVVSFKRLVNTGLDLLPKRHSFGKPNYIIVLIKQILFSKGYFM